MRVIDKTEFDRFQKVHLNKLKKGSVFIYPTDTIYGIGCDATNDDAIAKIRELKQRPDQPFSIIAPSIEWIRENCNVTAIGEEWLKKLPGPYTFIFELKNSNKLGKLVNPKDRTIGVRIPDHWISNVVKEFNKPVVTTSPNVHGEDVMTHPYELNVDFRAHTDFVIFEGRLHNPPSTVIKLTEEEASFLRGKSA